MSCDGASSGTLRRMINGGSNGEVSSPGGEVLRPASIFITDSLFILWQEHRVAG